MSELSAMAHRNAELADALRAICKRFDVDTNMSAEDAAKNVLEALGRDYMRLPVDADGVPIRPGDTMQFRNDAPVQVDSIGSSKCYANDFGWFGSNGAFYGTGTLSCFRHVKPRSLEDVLQDFGDEVWNTACDEMGVTWSDSGLDASLGKYADEIREMMGGER